MLDNSLFITIQDKHQSLRTSFSMDDFGLRFILEELHNKKCKNIIEFGSGLSTIYLAELIRKSLLEVKITSVESDAYWLDKVKKHADEHDLSQYINFIYAPVYPDVRLGGYNKWYDLGILEKIISSTIRFDLVIIDGPIAYYPDIELSRYGAVPFVISRISDTCTIVLDDCNRKGEKEVMELWKKEFGLSFSVHNGRMAVCDLT